MADDFCDEREFGYGGDEEKKDIHEKNQSYLSYCYEAADYVAKKWGWRTVECCDQNGLRSPGQIEQSVWEALADFFGASSDWTNGEQ